MLSITINAFLCHVWYKKMYVYGGESSVIIWLKAEESRIINLVR